MVCCIPTQAAAGNPVRGSVVLSIKARRESKTSATRERQRKSQPLYLCDFTFGECSRQEESYRHQNMQNAWESDSCLVLSRLNAQTPPSIARICLITAGTIHGIVTSDLVALPSPDPESPYDVLARLGPKPIKSKPSQTQIPSALLTPLPRFVRRDDIIQSKCRNKTKNRASRCGNVSRMTKRDRAAIYQHRGTLSDLFPLKAM